jgi:addiction module HigA family antidote
MFLDEMGISQVAFAAHCRMSLQRLNEIINGKRGVSPETAWIFGQALGTTAEYWINMQTAHDLTKARPATAIPRIHGVRPKVKVTEGAPERRRANR